MAHVENHADVIIANIMSCIQGVTGILLTLGPIDPGVITALFRIMHVDEVDIRIVE